MRLYFLHSLFTYVFLFAISDSQWMALGSQLCAFDTGEGILCINHTLNSAVCPVEQGGKRAPCVEITSHSSCRRDLNPDAIQAKVMKVGTKIDENRPPDYPLPASQNMLYLVGYSKNLSMPQYKCIASSYLFYQYGGHYRKLLLKEKARSGPWDKEGILRIEATLCLMTMNLSWTCQIPKLNGLQKQYLMLYYTWDTMVLSELIQQVGVKPNCSLWAKKDYVTKLEVTTRDYFMSLCDNPEVVPYPEAYDTVRGIMFHAHYEFSEKEILADLQASNFNIPIMSGTRMGQTRHVLVALMTQNLPKWIAYHGTDIRLYLSYNRVESCFNCCDVGHRTDVCPMPPKQRCHRCGEEHPPPGQGETPLRDNVCQSHCFVLLTGACANAA
ncbi:uncharacterized protein LOC142767803 [Rhipicephalus microplus]|uniref:uncharacterized protein LOC142767803 n=1 Tax=Rhipicephalus microplus TaxID=6941 RepID=UPI003F6D7AEA